jgi:hypothetical protein
MTITGTTLKKRVPLALLALAAGLAALGGGAAKADEAGAIAQVRQVERVVDVGVDTHRNMWVIVKADSKVNWNAFASGVCSLVQPYGARIFLVKVVDSTSVPHSRDPAKWTMLGGANCGN